MAPQDWHNLLNNIKIIGVKHMKIAVLADIHGNLIALEAVLKDIKANKIDQIIVLGDMITDFPDDTNTVLDIIKDKAQYIIKGNRESYLLNRDINFNGYKQFLTINQTHDIISPDNLKFISSLPEQISIIYDNLFSLRCVHGTPFSPFELIYEDDESTIKKVLSSINEKILLCGHSHCQWYKEIGDKIILNPGSVGINFSGDKTAQYAIIKYENGIVSIRLKALPYDFETLKSKYSPNNSWNELCIISMEKGENYLTRFLEEAKTKCNEWPIPNNVWDDLFEEWHKKKII
jgi:putative phosphoesterase